MFDFHDEGCIAFIVQVDRDCLLEMVDVPEYVLADLMEAAGSNDAREVGAGSTNTSNTLILCRPDGLYMF